MTKIMFPIGSYLENKRIYGIVVLIEQVQKFNYMEELFLNESLLLFIMR